MPGARDYSDTKVSTGYVPVCTTFFLVLGGGGSGSTALCTMLSSCFKMASDRAKWSNNVHIQLHTRDGLFKAGLR